jgi:putative transcriptional regulator
VDRRGIRTGATVSSAPRVANRIREWRQQGNLTQEQLAQRCGVTRQTIIALEAGRYSPSLELAFRLSRALGRTLDEVFQWSEEK